MRYLVVIALAALLLVLVLRRLGPHLRIVQEFIKALRHFQRATGDNSGKQQGEKLVCCETCGIWIPSGRALTRGATDSVYCSTDCLSARKKRKRATS